MAFGFMGNSVLETGRARAVRRWTGAAVGTALIATLAACSGGGVETMTAAMRPLPKETTDLMAKKGMSASSPVFVRIFKEESELEIWKLRDDGHYHHFKSYPICNWSGGLGPKVKQGDHQAPEGFYTVGRDQLNPTSQFHLAFNVGFPNAYDRAHGRTGAHLMVHGDCRSAGCYAMTDALVEEIYGLAREAFLGGQEKFDVHAFPFRMTPENLKRHAKSPYVPFWNTMKEGYDYFELTRLPPPVAICEKRYVVNARFTGGAPVQADAACPAFERPKPQLFVEQPAGGGASQPGAKPGAKFDPKLAEARIMAPGKKTRNLIAEASGEGPIPAGTQTASRSTFSWGLGGAVQPSAGSSVGFTQK